MIAQERPGLQRTLDELLTIKAWSYWPWIHYLRGEIKRRECTPPPRKRKKPKPLPNPFSQIPYNPFTPLMHLQPQPKELQKQEPNALAHWFAVILDNKGDNEMSEEQKAAEKKRSSRKELFEVDINRALESLAKAQKYLQKAADRLPKKTPKMVPDGTSLAQRYKGGNLQDIFKDCNNAGKGKEEGIINGLMDVCEDMKKLIAGEGGFEL